MQIDYEFLDDTSEKVQQLIRRLFSSFEKSSFVD